MDFAPAIPQAVLAALDAQPVPPGSPPNRRNRWPELAFPAYATAVSVCVLLVQQLVARRKGSTEGFAIGYGSILGWRVARFVACAALVGLSVSVSVQKKAGWRGFAVMDGPYLYATVLAALSLNPKKYHQSFVRHANFVLFVAAAVYIYRDVVPLATFTQLPLDRGAKMVATVALVLFAGIVVPLFTPRLYTPVDLANPQKEVNPEQTASLFSFIFYFFLDKIIFSAYRQSELPEDQLYALCDTDSAAHLRDRSFKHLDVFTGAKKHYIFFGLMRVYWREFSILAVLLVLRSLTAYSGPFAMNKLLQYVETRDDIAAHVVRPWVWVVLIGLGPLLGSLIWQLYIFINTRTLVRTEAIITQLVFAQSLRIRMKADVSEKKKGEEATAPATPAGVETPSAAEEASADSGSMASEGATETAGAGDEAEAESTTVQPSSASVKSGTESVKKGEKKAEEPTKEKSVAMVGRINNLVTTDLDNIGREFLDLLVYMPLQLSIGIYFLYVLLGWSVWVGVASIVVLAPVPGYMAKLVGKVQKERLKYTDERVSSASEAVNVLRMVKLFGWEGKMRERILEKRDEELKYIWKRRLLELASALVKHLPHPYLDDGLDLCHIALVMRQPLTASKVFSSMTIFDFIRDSISRLTWQINQLMTGKVSLDRVNDFLHKTELLDEFETKNAETAALLVGDAAQNEQIGFCNATFAWSKDPNEGARSRSSRQFQLRVDGEVLFERGKINLIVGPTGSGKTSMLMALLGEMHFVPSSPDSWFNLPRTGGVAYATQESWVLNETIRDNIVFDTPYDEARYKKVLYQCALEPDLALFQAGDQTEVGEKGLTLSGGQKARLTLARAVYSKARMLLLDDILAALDVHTATWIVEKLFSGDLIEGRTVLLVTHNIALTQPIADYIVSFGADGRIQAQGAVSEITKRGAVAAQLVADEEALDKQQQVVDPHVPEDTKPKTDEGKLIVAEEIQLGHVSAASLKMFLSAIGGKHPIRFFVIFYGGLFLQQFTQTLRTWLLGYWASQYDDRPADEVDVVLNLTLFCSAVLATIIALTSTYAYFTFAQLRASKVIHTQLIESVLAAPLRWLDVTPVSRIIARVTKDIRAVDDSLSQQMWHLSALVTSMMMRFAAIVLYAPVFFFPAIAVGAFGAWMGQIYIAGQLPVKRMMSNARAPVLANFGAAIAGLASIRAFGAQEKFNAESLVRLDRYTRAARNFYNLNRWISVRVDVVGALFGAGLAGYLVYIQPISAGSTGFAINMALVFTQMLLWVVRILNDFEVQGNSLERIKSYLDIEHEKLATEAGKPPAYWPASGELVVEGLSARYSEDGPKVLEDVSFSVKAGERVGIVGRTGSGKRMSRARSRCRSYAVSRRTGLYYDGLDTANLNLDALRTSITIIPQVPELLSGTLRSNLDPFGDHDDAELNSALRAAGLFALQSELDEGRITLDSDVHAGGGNLSVGQRQIFALARAIVRKSKILILDEATSAIDYKTDAIIQKSLREELPSDVSLLTVAHRLQTIMDSDRIMVLDSGKIVEYDSPKELLKLEGGKLRALVDESGDREILYEMAGAKISR